MKRTDLKGSPNVCIISAKRAENVPAMLALVGPATWYVPVGEGKAYLDAGADAVVESGGLCESRNAMLQNSFCGFPDPLPCIQLSDDLKRIQRAQLEGEKKVAVDITFDVAVEMVVTGLRTTIGRLAGAAPTSNPFYWNPKKNVHNAAFIVGDFMYVLPSVQRFDEELKLKEDYDFTLQHLKAHQHVARRNDLLMTFAHRTNKGGAVAYRTSELEKATIAQLKEKWGAYIQDNPRRPDEILLRLK